MPISDARQLHCRRLVPVPSRLIVRWCLCAAIATAGLTARPQAAAPILREGSLHVTYAGANSCEVEARFRVSPGSASSIEHRLPVAEGTISSLLESARPIPAPHVIGRTRVLEIPVSGADDVYSFRYSVRQPADQSYRCPLWMPAAPADGQSRSVEIRVTLPPGGTPAGGAFPALEWAGDGGRTVLGHVPAFILVPFNAADAPAVTSWNISRVMDTTAVLLLIAGMAVFVLRKRG